MVDNCCKIATKKDIVNILSLILVNNVMKDNKKRN